MLTASSLAASRNSASAASFSSRLRYTRGSKRSAQPVDRRAVDHFDALARLLGLEPHQFEQAHLGNGVAIAAAGHDQRRNDGQGQRNLDPDRRASARRGLHVDGAADLFDVGLHHVHAHAAAGDVGHFLRGGKSGQEDQVEDLPFGHARRLFGGDQAALDRLFADAFPVQARRRRR